MLRSERTSAPSGPTKNVTKPKVVLLRVFGRRLFDDSIVSDAFAKNKREHLFPLSPMAQKVITQLPDTGDLLFPAATDFEKPFTTWAWHKKWFNEGLEDVGQYTLHGLRRTFATFHAQIGTPIHVTEKLLNHASGTISGVAAVYNRHSYADEMKTALSRYHEWLKGLAGL